jgi:hypothetical protein
VTVNPLVAGRLDQPTDAWAGVWIAEDIELIGQGIKNGSWIDGSLGVVGAGLDAIVSDPVGALLQYGVAWIIEHVKPLTEALDRLASDPGQIAGHAQTWRNVARSLHESASNVDGAVRWDVSDWGGTAGPAYRTWAKQQQDAIAGLGKAAETMAMVTEGAGMLIAAVRILVRDAIATCVSRLITYAAEEAFSLGVATPLVVEQVATLVASWAGKIARWLKALLASLRRLIPPMHRLGELIEELKKILNRLQHGDELPRWLPGGESRQDLLDELKRQGIKHNPDDIVEIGRTEAGQIVFLEKGNSRAGLQHITDRHAAEFASIGVPEEKIAKLVLTAVTTGRVVGTQRTRPIYEVVFEGQLYKLAVSVGNNGFIVGGEPGWTLISRRSR